MNANFTAPIATRIAAFAAAILTSTVVLGATLIGMQPETQTSDLQVIALERVVVTAPAVH
jgi:hypothetical protein